MMNIEVDEKEDLLFFNDKIQPLYLYLCKFIFTVSRDEQLTRDIVQETMEAAWCQIKQVEKYTYLKAALKKIAMNKLSYYYKNNPAYLDFTEISLLFADEENTTFKIIEEIENNEILIAKIKTLKPEYVRIILLYYGYDLSLKKISKVLNIPYGTVVSWHKRALFELRKKYNLILS